MWDRVKLICLACIIIDCHHVLIQFGFTIFLFICGYENMHKYSVLCTSREEAIKFCNNYLIFYFNLYTFNTFHTIMNKDIASLPQTNDVFLNSMTQKISIMRIEVHLIFLFLWLTCGTFVCRCFSSLNGPTVPYMSHNSTCRGKSIFSDWELFYYISKYFK